MGNCQAVDAAALVIQHPDGKVQRLYWSVTANEVMKMNPGHYVSLIIPLPLSEDESGPTVDKKKKKTVRYTRVKLLRATDTLVLGRAYRLVTSQEVQKVVMAKRKAKMNEKGSSGSEKIQTEEERETDDSETNDQGSDHARRRLTSRSMNSRSKSWRPSLQSISEATI